MVEHDSSAPGEVDVRVLTSVPVPCLLVDDGGSIIGQNALLDVLLGGSMVGWSFDDVLSASSDGDDQHRARRVDGDGVDVRLTTCDPAPSGTGRMVFVAPMSSEHLRSATANWLHDEVIPLAMTAGLRVDLASIDAVGEQLEHLAAASAALVELGTHVHDEMLRALPE